MHCSSRFTTYERYEETPLLVLKKDGRREHFDRRKVLDGLLRACEKRPVRGSSRSFAAWGKPKCRPGRSASW